MKNHPYMYIRNTLDILPNCKHIRNNVYINKLGDILLGDLKTK